MKFDYSSATHLLAERTASPRERGRASYRGYEANHAKNPTKFSEPHKYNMKQVDDPSTPKKHGAHKLGTTQIEGYVVGRDKTVVPPEEVQKLASIGCKDLEIANWFGINDNTLRFNFSVELLKGREELKLSLRRAMFNNAIHLNNTVMQIFLAKNFLGMSDNPALSEDNKPLPWIERDDVDIEQPTEEEMKDEL